MPALVLLKMVRQQNVNSKTGISQELRHFTTNFLQSLVGSNNVAPNFGCRRNGSQAISEDATTLLNIDKEAAQECLHVVQPAAAVLSSHQPPKHMGSFGICHCRKPIKQR
jgi:hypothetical protein